MKHYVVSLLIWFLVGCSRGGPGESTNVEAARQEAAPEAKPAGAGLVTLDEAAWRQAGVAVETLAMRDVGETLSVSGRITLNENRSWRIGAVTEGRIVTVIANVGDRVEAGQVLGRMHTHEVHEGRAVYRRALTEASRLRALEAYQRRLRDRAKRLLEIKAGSMQELEHAETALRNAQAALSDSEVEVERARVHLVEYLGVSAEASGQPKEGQPHGEEDLVPIRAPAAGVVMHRNVTQGTVVAPSAELFVISDVAALWMAAQVPEEKLSRLRVGMAVRVKVQAYPDQAFPGRITRLDEELDPATRTVRARVELPNPRGLLKPEMYAVADISVPGARPALLVPETALQDLNGLSSLFVEKAPGQFQAVPVETGMRQGGLIEILRGVSPGDKVVTHGSFTLKAQLMRGSLAEE